MIIVASSSPPESASLLDLLEVSGWPAKGCSSVRVFAGMLLREVPRLIIVRQRLGDGYSDDILRLVAEVAVGIRTRVIVLLAADASPAVLVRQIELGADTVLRDPVRSDVLLAYSARFLQEIYEHSIVGEGRRPRSVRFANADWRSDERTLTVRGSRVVLTQRESMLVDLLVRSKGEVVSYETLYAEIIGRPFDGDTSNMRVLLGRLGASLRSVGCRLRDWIEVLPKNGYRYGSDGRSTHSRHGRRRRIKNRKERYG